MDDFNIIFYGPECAPEGLIDESGVSKTINGSQPPRRKWIAKHAEISDKTPLNGFDNLGTINPNQVVLAFHNYLCTDDCEVFIEPSQLEVLNTAMETGDPNLYLESALRLAFDADIKEDEYKQVIAPAIKELNNKLLNLNKKPYLYQNIENNKAKQIDDTAIPKKSTPPESIMLEPVSPASELSELVPPENKQQLLALPKVYRHIIQLLLRRAERLTRFKQRYQRGQETGRKAQPLGIGEVVIIIAAILFMISMPLYQLFNVFSASVTTDQAVQESLQPPIRDTFEVRDDTDDYYLLEEPILKISDVTTNSPTRFYDNILSSLHYVDGDNEGIYWGDSDNGRGFYTRKDVYGGAIGDKIVFNSVTDSDIGDERNFVGVALLDDTGAVWYGNSIEVEDETTYVICLYVQNDNPQGLNAIAEDVRVVFSLPTTVSNSHNIVGYIDASNAGSARYWDCVNMYSDREFYIQFLEGSARYFNSSMGNIQLSEDVITSGVPLGYDRFDGKIPGGQKYTGVVTIEVKVHRTVSSKLSMKARLKGTKHWTEEVFANVGDEIEMRIEYKNLTAEEVHDVKIRDVLPDNLQYVPQSTYLYNANNPDGVLIDRQTITTSGINIGNYDALKDAYVQFSCVVVDTSLKKLTQLVNWASATVNGEVFKDDVSVMVDK